MQRLNRFYECATSSVIARDGTVDKLLGEEVIAFFGTPYNDREHERRAVEAALEVIRSVGDFPPGEISACGAVGTGVAFVGNVGEGETHDYTAIGLFVNVVTALRSHAAPGELLLLPETYAAVSSSFPGAGVRAVTIRPGREPVGVRVITAAGARPSASPPEGEGAVATTILTLDLVGSTEVAARLGDIGWRDLLARHYAELRLLLLEHRGAEVDIAGDGLLATFSAPPQAIRFAWAMCAKDRELGLAARVGIHAGEVVRDGSAIRGIAVVVASRIAALAGPDEVLVSGAVRDLAAGPGIAFADRGVRSLKGVPEPRPVFQALSVGD